MAAPAYVANGANWTTAASLSISAPAGIQSGDLLIAHVVNKVASGWTPPSGWTLLRSDTSVSPYVSSIFTKSATGSEPASYVFTTTTSGDVTGIVAAYRGARADSHATTAYSTNPTTVVHPSVNASGAGLALRFLASSDRPQGYPTGTTGRVQMGGFTHIGQYLADQPAGPGATGTASFAWTAVGYATTVALAPLNTAPNAPTLNSPANNATIDRGVTQRFAWTFSDPDAGDSQSKFDLQYRIVNTTPWTTVSSTTPNTFYDFAASTFAAGNYEWQVRTYDSQGVVGPWCSSSFFTAADAPAGPTITAPVNGATVNNTATLTWSTPNQTDYQWRRVKDNAGSADTSTIYQDSGDVVDSTTRSVTVAFDTNNRYEHLQVRIKNAGLWSSWADIRVQVSYTPPTTPTVALTPNSAAGTLSIAITNPAPGAGVPVTAYNDVYIDDGDGTGSLRKFTNVATNTTITYYRPRSGQDYAGHVKVTAVASNGTTATGTA